MICCDHVIGGETSDRLDIILSQITKMGKRMDGLVNDVSDLKNEVGTIAGTEEQVEMKVCYEFSKIEKGVIQYVRNALGVGGPLSA